MLSVSFLNAPVVSGPREQSSAQDEQHKLPFGRVGFRALAVITQLTFIYTQLNEDGVVILSFSIQNHFY